MAQRLDRFEDRIPAEISAATQIDLARLLPEITARMRPGPSVGFDLSVLGRMLFSCLVDADFRDTEAYYDRLEGREKDRDWPALPDILPELRGAFDAHMAQFRADIASCTILPDR